MTYKAKEINRNNFKCSDLLLINIVKIINQFTHAYPDIELWFSHKVIPGLELGERTILYILNDKDIIALSILKNTLQEKKICTFYISPEARGKGLAEILFKKSFIKLNTKKPFITVPENVIHHFNKYLSQYHFLQTNTRFLADQRTREFEFNGR